MIDGFSSWAFMFLTITVIVIIFFPSSSCLYHTIEMSMNTLSNHGFLAGLDIEIGPKGAQVICCPHRGRDLPE